MKEQLGVNHEGTVFIGFLSPEIIEDSKRMLQIRQPIGLNLSIAKSTSPLRTAAYINSDRFSCDFAGRRPIYDNLPYRDLKMLRIPRSSFAWRKRWPTV
jgi:hypothetical protein